MGAARDNHRQQQDEGYALHSIAVAKSIDTAMQPVQLDGQYVEARSDKASSKSVRAKFRLAQPFKQRRRGQSEPKQPYSLAARAFSLGKFRPLDFHALRSTAWATCPPPGPPARGALAMTCAAFAMVAWVTMRGVM